MKMRSLIFINIFILITSFILIPAYGDNVSEINSAYNILEKKAVIFVEYLSRIEKLDEQILKEKDNDKLKSIIKTQEELKRKAVLFLIETYSQKISVSTFWMDKDGELTKIVTYSISVMILALILSPLAYVQQFSPKNGKQSAEVIAGVFSVVVPVAIGFLAQISLEKLHKNFLQNKFFTHFWKALKRRGISVPRGSNKFKLFYFENYLMRYANSEFYFSSPEFLKLKIEALRDKLMVLASDLYASHPEKSALVNGLIQKLEKILKVKLNSKWQGRALTCLVDVKKSLAACDESHGIFPDSAQKVDILYDNLYDNFMNRVMLSDFYESDTLNFSNELFPASLNAQKILKLAGYAIWSSNFLEFIKSEVEHNRRVLIDFDFQTEIESSPQTPTGIYKITAVIEVVNPNNQLADSHKDIVKVEAMFSSVHPNLKKRIKEKNWVIPLAKAIEKAFARDEVSTELEADVILDPIDKLSRAGDSCDRLLALKRQTLSQ